MVYRSNLISSSKDLPRLEFEDINSGLGTLNKDISQKLDYRKGLEFNVGDVLFGKLRPYLKNWWYAEFKGIALGDFWNLKSDLWHSCFLYTYIQSNSFQLVANDTSGTKMPRSDWNLVAESIAKFPSLPEQEAIGTFFSTLDQHITLHQRKLDTLKEQKKTYLKLLFPAKGQTKPALRFQGFEDDWEEVKLGEVLSVSKLKNKENEYSKLNVLSVSREQGTVNQIEYQGRSFASDDVSGYKIVNVGQMIYTKSPLKGAPYGIFQTVTINGIVSPLYAVYNSSGRALASFVSLILKEDAIATHYLSPLVTKGAKNTINVTDEGALEGKVKIPTLPEQQAIGTFFQTLDREISQVEDKLASLKELKKTLLRKLFV